MPLGPMAEAQGSAGGLSTAAADKGAPAKPKATTTGCAAERLRRFAEFNATQKERRRPPQAAVSLFHFQFS